MEEKERAQDMSKGQDKKEIMPNFLKDLNTEILEQLTAGSSAASKSPCCLFLPFPFITCACRIGFNWLSPAMLSSNSSSLTQIFT